MLYFTACSKHEVTIMKDIFLTVHEFADLHNVNKRTLHYYDAAGIFSPRKTGNNGYRYYTYSQSAEFEIILALRDLGMSLDEIKEYVSKRGSESFKGMLLQKGREIHEKINRLKYIQALIKKEHDDLETALSDSINNIEIIETDPEYFMFTDVRDITYEDDIAEKVYDNFAAHGIKENPLHYFNAGYGSVISAEKIYSGRYGEYDYMYVKIPKGKNRKNLYMRQAGKYLCAFSENTSSSLRASYEKLISYSESEHIILKGYAFETPVSNLIRITVPFTRL